MFAAVKQDGQEQIADHVSTVIKLQDIATVASYVATLTKILPLIV